MYSKNIYRKRLLKRIGLSIGNGGCLELQRGQESSYKNRKSNTRNKRLSRFISKQINIRNVVKNNRKLDVECSIGVHRDVRSL